MTAFYTLNFETIFSLESILLSLFDTYGSEEI